METMDREKLCIVQKSNWKQQSSKGSTSDKLFTIVMPIVFLFKLPSILKEYDGEITYSQDGKTLLKVAENCRRVKIKKGVEVVGEGAFDSTRVRHIYLPNTIRIFEPNALLRAHYLESINLPVSLVKIEETDSP